MLHADDGLRRIQSTLHGADGKIAGAITFAGPGPLRLPHVATSRSKATRRTPTWRPTATRHAGTNNAGPDGSLLHSDDVVAAVHDYSTSTRSDAPSRRPTRSRLDRIYLTPTHDIYQTEAFAYDAHGLEISFSHNGTRRRTGSGSPPTTRGISRGHFVLRLSGTYGQPHTPGRRGPT